MDKRLRLTIAATVVATGVSGVTGVSLSAVASASTGAKGPTCSTVSGAAVKAALGGSVQSLPGSSTSSNSFDGYKATVLSCTYSATVSISYSTPATVADYKLALATLKHATTVTVVSGLGNAAFSGTGTNTVGTYNPKTKKTTSTTVKTVNLWVLVTGKTFFEISASKVTLAQEKTLAKKMVPLV